MCRDDDTTPSQLQEMLTRHGIWLPLGAIISNKQQLKWKFRGSACRRPLRGRNKQKRLDWAQQNIFDDFSDVIWSGEALIELETIKQRQHCTRRHCDRRPIRMHMWAAISKRGATKICIFEGVMGARFYNSVLEEYLLPLIQQMYPLRHRFVQNNSTKHTSCSTRGFLEENNVSWWETPAESPDLNPIENVWYDLSEHLCTIVRPSTQLEAVQGIESFWATLNQTKCTYYIDHLRKVVPRVIELKGAATGY